MADVVTIMFHMFIRNFFCIRAILGMSVSLVYLEDHLKNSRKFNDEFIEKVKSSQNHEILVSTMFRAPERVHRDYDVVVFLCDFHSLFTNS